MEQANKGIRATVKHNHLRLWEVADAAGIADTTLSVWLRKPLLGERKQRVLDAIAKLTAEK